MEEMKGREREKDESDKLKNWKSGWVMVQLNVDMLYKYSITMYVFGDSFFSKSCQIVFQNAYSILVSHY